MEYFNEIRENGLFDYILITIVTKASLFQKDFIYAIITITLIYLMKMNFKKIYKLIEKK